MRASAPPAGRGCATKSPGPRRPKKPRGACGARPRRPGAGAAPAKRPPEARRGPTERKPRGHALGPGEPDQRKAAPPTPKGGRPQQRKGEPGTRRGQREPEQAGEGAPARRAERGSGGRREAGGLGRRARRPGADERWGRGPSAAGRGVAKKGGERNPTAPESRTSRSSEPPSRAYHDCFAGSRKAKRSAPGAHRALRASVGGSWCCHEPSTSYPAEVIGCTSEATPAPPPPPPQNHRQAPSYERRCAAALNGAERSVRFPRFCCAPPLLDIRTLFRHRMA